jgi:cytochrome c oxidase subunit 2
MARTFRDRRDQIPAVADYVAALPPVSPGRTLELGEGEALTARIDNGKGLYTAVCQTCHGENGEGVVNSAQYPDLPNLAPPLNIADDWYMLTQLKKFKSGIRGAHPDDKYGKAMANMVLVLNDESAMKDVIAYITTLPQ